MDFDFGEVLTRGWQITWKHKVLWIYGALPMFFFMLYLPLFFIFFIPLMAPGSDMLERLMQLVQHPAFNVIFLASALVTTSLSLAAQLIGGSAMTLGALRADEGAEKLDFRDLFKSCLPFVWRVLGTTSVVFLAVLVLMMVFAVCSAVAGAVTFGIGSMFLHFLSYPILLAAWIMMEQAQTAVVADGLGVRDSVERAWELFKAHVWKFLLIGAVVYFASSLLSGFMILPLLVPVWFAVFSSLVLDTIPHPGILLASMLCAAAFAPLYAVFQGAALTFMRSTFVVTYLRLTRGPEAGQALLKAVV